MLELKLEMFLEDMLKSSLFRNKAMEKDGKEVRKSLVLGMMLLDEKYMEDISFESLGDVTTEEYCRRVEKSYSNRQKNTLRSAIEYLENTFLEGQEYINTEDFPILIYLADAAEYREIEPEVFREWWFTLWGDKK